MSAVGDRTRLMRVSSSDAATKTSPSRFSIDIGNVSHMEDIRAVALEGCGFINAHPNIEMATTFTILLDNNPGLTRTYTVPRGQYTFDALAALLVANMADIASITITAAGYCRIAASGIYTIYLSTASWGLLGFSPEQIGVLHGNSVTAVYVPALSGLQVCYLHSDVLGGPHSIDGSGLHASFMSHIPISVPYGFQQVHAPPTYGAMPSIVYPDKQTLRRIDLALLTHEGEDVDIGNSELWAIFRLWF